MKNPVVNTAIIAALVSIIGKMIYHIFLQEVEDMAMNTRFFYLLCFLMALLFGLRNWKSQKGVTKLTDDVKAGMQVTGIFSVIIAAFTYVYYQFINPAYFAERIAERVEHASQNVEAVDVEQVRNTAEFVFSSFIHSTITLFGFMIIGFFYTLVLVLIMRAKPELFRG
mgnify:FL=1